MTVSRSAKPSAADEEARLDAVERLEILDTERERRFDVLIGELAKKLDVPIAYLALIAEDRQWVKSKVGPLPTETRREDAFCSRTILQSEPLLVTDAAKDPRFSASALVQGTPGVRFYAGVPIKDLGGHTVGTVCVAGPTPRAISPRDLAILQGFAARLQRELIVKPTVLLAYASADEAWIARFLAAYPGLDDPEIVELWSSDRLADQTGREIKVKDALWGAGTAVLMLSPAFLRSEFVRQPLFQRLLQAREMDAFSTTVVLLEPCDRSTEEWLAGRPLWPADQRPLADAPEDEIDRSLRELALAVVGQVPPRKDDAGAVRRAAGDTPAPQLFLSHSGEDTAAVKELAKRLRLGGIRVWLDADELQAGDDWAQRLEEALEEADAFAVYIGRSGVSRWVGREVRVALDRNTRDPRFRFIPILGPGSDPDSLPRFVVQHHWLDLRDGEAEPEEIRGLVASIFSRPAAAVSLLPPGEPPFRGLLTFDVEHTHLFFGRDQETAELVDKLRTSSFVTVIGDSGSGKSSLVRAGLVPALHRGHFRDPTGHSQPWRVAILKPGSSPFRELASALVELAGELSAPEKIRTRAACAEELADGTGGLCNLIRSLVPRGERTLLVIDQFEEVFTQSEDPDERDRFIDSLLEASTCEGERPLYTVVTLRADFFSHCFQHPTLPRTLSAGQYPVRAIAPDKMAEIIEKPAAMAGLTLEPGLVEAILFDIGEGPGHLPLLEHTLLELWKLRLGETLTHASYEEIGRVQGALEHHAEEVFGRFDEDERLLARKLLLALVVPTENTGPARRRARIDQVLHRDERRAAAEAVLDRLVEERLVMVRGSTSGAGESGDGDGGEGAPDDREVEVTHEALLRGWQRLRGWLEEDREYLFWRQRTQAAFHAWEESRRDAGALLRGAPLAEAERWLAQRADDLSADGRTFIRESIALAVRQKRIRRAVVAAIALSAVAALVFALLATRARREAVGSLLLATEAVDEMLTQVGSEALADVPQFEQVRQELLAKAQALYLQLGEQHSRAPGLRLQSALAPARMAEIHRQLGRREAERQGLAEAITALESLAGREARQPEVRLELSKIHDEMGRAIQESSPSEATDQYTRAIAIQEELIAEFPQRVEYAYELGRSHLNRGIARFLLGELDAAEADFLAAIAGVEPFAGDGGEWSAEIRQQLARGHNQLANLLVKQRKNAEAIAEYDRAAGLFAELSEDYPESRDYRIELAKAYRNLALRHRWHGDVVAARRYGDEAVDLLGDLADALPDIRSEWAKAYQTRGLVLDELAEPAAAVDSFERSAEVFADLLADYPERADDRFSFALTLLYLGSLHHGAGAAVEVARIRHQLEEVLSRLPATDRERIERQSRFRQIQGTAP